MKKKKLLIPENKFKSDFAPLVGFYDYHIKKKSIPIKLNYIQDMGVRLKVIKKRCDFAEIDEEEISVNTIIFSSSKKKNNVKNLFWNLRCIVAHPENIEEVKINDVLCYKIICITKDKETKLTIPTMKGIISCDVWSIFIKQLMDKILNINENV